MAVTLPVALLLYELIYNRKALASRAIIVIAMVTLVFVIGRAQGSESLLKISAYRPHFTVGQFLATSRNFFDYTFFHVTTYSLLTIWVVLFAVAWLSGSRVLRFSWFFLMISPLPVAFIASRGPAQYYIPWFGWVLYAGAALVESLDHLTRSVRLAPETFARVRGSILVLVLACILFPLYRSAGWQNATSVALEAPGIRNSVEQLHALHRRFPPHSRLLFRDDPFPGNRWTLTFLIKESYRDDSLEVYRLKQDGAPADEGEAYDYVFDYREDRFFDSLVTSQQKRATAPEPRPIVSK